MLLLLLLYVWYCCDGWPTVSRCILGALTAAVEALCAALIVLLAARELLLSIRSTDPGSLTDACAACRYMITRYYSLRAAPVTGPLPWETGGAPFKLS